MPIFAIMDDRLILISGQVEGFASRKDRTWRVTIGTPELPPETVAQLSAVANQHVHILVKPDPITEVEGMALDSIPTDLSHIKSHSHRLRAVLFLNWKQNSDGFTTFDSYYVNRMETLIEHFKGKLD